MGGGTSKFDLTNWSRANGELQSSRDTIDGSPPLREYQVITLLKRGMNQREFDIIDHQQNLLYTTKAVPGTLAWFDVLGPASCGAYEDLILRVQVDLTRRTWMVYRYNTPVFEGQRPASLSPLLFKTACITVSWSRYVAVAARYGPPSIAYLFHLDPDKGPASTTTTGSDESESQSLEEERDGTRSEDRSQTLVRTLSADSQDELFSAATSLATRRRSRHQPTSNAEEDDITPSSIHNTVNDKVSTSTRAKQVLANAVNSCSPGCRRNYENQSPDTTWHDPSAFDAIAASTSMAASEETATINTSTTNWLSRESRRTAAYQIAMQGIINLEGPLLECQEIYNKIIGNHQTTLISKDQVRRLLQWDEAQHAKLLLLDDEGTTSGSSIVETNNPLVEAVHDESQRDATPQPLDERIPIKPEQVSSHGNVWDRISEDGDDARTNLSCSSATTTPSLSPSTSRNEFEASLANIVAKQQKSSTNPLKSWLNSWGSSSTRSMGSVMSRRESIERARPASSSTRNFSQEQMESSSSVPPAMQPLSPEQKSELPNLMDEDKADRTMSCTSKPRISNDDGNDNSEQQGMPLDTNSASSSKVTSSIVQKEEPKEPLIGYWSWKNSYTVHKIEMHLARNTDLALHVVLAILCNQVRSERNAVAMTV